MKTWCTALAALLLAALPVWAHFLWIVPDKPGDDKATAQVFFSDTLKPDNPELLAKVSKTELFFRGPRGAAEELKWTEAKEAYQLSVPGTGPYEVGGVCRYGVAQRGSDEPFLLMYYPKAYLGTLSKASPPLFFKGWEKLPLEIIPAGPATGVFQVAWQGKPLPDAEVVVVTPGQEKGPELKTNKEGAFTVEVKEAGNYGIRVKYVEPKTGELDGKQYKEVRHYATLVMSIAPAKP